MKQFINATDLPLAPNWIKNKLKAYDTRPLRFHLKRHRRKDQLFSGYCRYKDFLIVAAIHEKLPLPFLLQKPIKSKPNSRTALGYEYIWREMTVTTADQALVWVAGHECWHYLCKTKQQKGNWETRANNFGFDWLEEFTQQTTKKTTKKQLSFSWSIFPATPKPKKKLKVIYG